MDPFLILPLLLMLVGGTYCYWAWKYQYRYAEGALVLIGLCALMAFFLGVGLLITRAVHFPLAQSDQIIILALGLILLVICMFGVASRQSAS